MLLNNNQTLKKQKAKHFNKQNINQTIQSTNYPNISTQQCFNFNYLQDLAKQNLYLLSDIYYNDVSEPLQQKCQNTHNYKDMNVTGWDNLKIQTTSENQNIDKQNEKQKRKTKSLFKKPVISIKSNQNMSKISRIQVPVKKFSVQGLDNHYKSIIIEDIDSTNLQMNINNNKCKILYYNNLNVRNNTKQGHRIMQSKKKRKKKLNNSRSGVITSIEQFRSNIVKNYQNSKQINSIKLRILNNIARQNTMIGLNNQQEANKYALFNHNLIERPNTSSALSYYQQNQQKYNKPSSQYSRYHKISDIVTKTQKSIGATNTSAKQLKKNQQSFKVKYLKKSSLPNQQESKKLRNISRSKDDNKLKSVYSKLDHSILRLLQQKYSVLQNQLLK